VNFPKYVGATKWQPQFRDYVCFSILTTYKLQISASIADSKTIVTAPPIFESSNSMVLSSIVPDIGSPDIQDSGLQTVRTYISACVNCGRWKLAQSAKDGQRDTMHITLHYTIAIIKSEGRSLRGSRLHWTITKNNPKQIECQ